MALTIQDRIKKLGSYFHGMKVENINDVNVIYVIASFPHGWEISPESGSKYNVSIVQTNDGQYYFCAEMEVGFETVFTVIEECVDRMINLQERNVIFKQKLAELNELFMDESISTNALKTIEFNYKGKKKATKQKNDPVVLKEEDNNTQTEQATNE